MDEQNLLTKLKEVLIELENLEKNYRKIYNSAVDIEEFEISQKTQSDAYLKIRKLKDWKGLLIGLNDNIRDSNVIEIIPLNESNDKLDDKSEIMDQVSDKTVVINTASQEPSEYDSEEQIKVGKYVCRKMYELSNSGFIFSDNDIDEMQKKTWAKENLTLDYEFIKKITYINHSITEQMKKELGFNRFWKETFKFGKYKILMTNQLFERDIKNFDSWYEKLDKAEYITKQNLKDNGKGSTDERAKNTCKVPISIKLFDKMYPIKSWNEILIKVCEVMLLKKPYVVATFGRELTLNSEQWTNFSYTESEIKDNKKRLSNGLWIETNRSANDIVNVSKTILKLCGFNEKDLIIDC
ncbi:MAG: hypothetical protein ACREVX_02365 [Clostridium sp.]|uniref:hypothetical protein n=1 Tax=Clostridium sp. TaxID=1506 RepID=UPI003D6D82A2